MNSLGAGNDLLVCCDNTIASNIQDFNLGLSFIEQVQPKLFEFSNVYPESNVLRQQSTTIVQPDLEYIIKEYNSNLEANINVYVQQYVGFVSQELQSINPDFVHTYSNTNILAPTYSFSRQYKLAFINAIKELAPKIYKTQFDTDIDVTPSSTPIIWDITGPINKGNVFENIGGGQIRTKKDIIANLTICLYGEGTDLNDLLKVEVFVNGIINTTFVENINNLFTLQIFRSTQLQLNAEDIVEVKVLSIGPGIITLKNNIISGSSYLIISN